MATAADPVEGDVEAEVARGQEDEIIKEYPKSKRTKVVKKVPRPKPKVPSKVIKKRRPIVRRPTPARIKELSRPTRRHLLLTLTQGISTLSPVIIDNLIRMLESESCLTPEEAAQVLRKKKRKKKARLPIKKLKKITKDAIKMVTLEKDAIMCQYLLAECFVKSILTYQCRSQNEDIRDIAEVILKRLTSLDEYTNVQNGSRAAQQLRLLANIIACWIAEVLMEVAETRKEALEEYCEKRQKKMMEVEEDEEIEDWQKEEEIVEETVEEEITETVVEETEIVETT